MTFPDPCTITRPGAAGAVDDDFGQPVAEPAAVVIYEGGSRLDPSDLRQEKDAMGNRRFAGDQRVFLPPGEHGVREEDTYTTGSRQGRIVRDGLFATAFYTELYVLWENAA